jgi:hypothetical protein
MDKLEIIQGSFIQQTQYFIPVEIDLPVPYGHAPTYQLSLTYLKRQKCYGPNKKILFKKQLFDPEVKGQGPKKVMIIGMWVHDHKAVCRVP